MLCQLHAMIKRYLFHWVLREVVTLSVTVPFPVMYPNKPLTLDYLWAGLCQVDAMLFMFRSKFLWVPAPGWPPTARQCRISRMKAVLKIALDRLSMRCKGGRTLALSLSLLLAACTGMPEGVRPVEDFELDRYLGKWYEIARLDHPFERGLSRVTAEYSLREDGGVRVLNRGFSADKGEWEEAEGKAYFVKQPDLGYLKVSFFGPFYGSYIVFELDREGYQYSFISGPKTSYLWLLARTPTVSNEVLQRFVERASALGFDTDALILVDQD